MGLVDIDLHIDPVLWMLKVRPADGPEQPQQGVGPVHREHDDLDAVHRRPLQGRQLLQAGPGAAEGPDGRRGAAAAVGAGVFGRLVAEASRRRLPKAEAGSQPDGDYACDAGPTQPRHAAKAFAYCQICQSAPWLEGVKARTGGHVNPSFRYTSVPLCLAASSLSLSLSLSTCQTRSARLMEARCCAMCVQVHHPADQSADVSLRYLILKRGRLRENV